MTFAPKTTIRGRRVAAIAATALISATVAVPAHAETATAPAGSSDFQPAQIQQTVTDAFNNALWTIFPNLKPAQPAVQQQPAPAPTPAPAPAPEPKKEEKPAFDTSRCPKSARACIDLDRGITWLQKDGVLTYGPVKESAGAPYPATATPRGTHYVNRKVKDEYSRPHNNAPMPYSTYFTNNGIAFHQGDTNLWSHGCIHLERKDAMYYFNNLKIGDKVYVI